ncbi:MAG: T9SS type A sorting domain-containing protein [Bacteroidia bacterium]|nr:T9SS type A sorting domain-containing protein [Bacteroidia bacterium]
MKNCFLLIILVALTYGPLKAQMNLVPNPSFENYTSCPTSLGKIHYAPPWTIAIWNNTSDYYNECNSNGWSGYPSNLAGYQYARTGIAYAGIGTYSYNGIPTNAKEYIQVELIDSLITGIEYCVSFFVSPGDSCHRVCNDFGAYFSSTMIIDSCGGLNYCTLPFTPQIQNPANNDISDRAIWNEISGSFIASGGERYLILGNFKDTASSTAALTGWSNIPSLTFAYYYIDDVFVTPCDSLTRINEAEDLDVIQLFPTIVNSEINIYSYTLDITTLTVLNITGQLILQENYFNTNSLKLNIDKLAKGFYIINIQTKKSLTTSYFIKL